MTRIAASLRRSSVPAAAALFALVLGGEVEAQLAFPVVTSYPEQFGAYAVELSDIDLDGDLDVLTAVYDAHYLSVRRSDDRGVLGAAETYPIGGGVALAAGDLNSDDRPDVAVADFQYGVVQVLFNKGAPGQLIAGPRIDLAGRGPRDLTLADLDGDGDRDLAIACALSGTVMTYANDGNGGFAEPIELPSGLQPKAIESGDLDGDGAIDLVVDLYGEDRVQVLRNLGGRTFAPSLLVAGDRPSGVAVGDLNADGRPDIAVANEDETASVFLNEGAGSFGIAASYAVGVLAQAVVLHDMDGDSSLDLVVANYWGGSITLRYNTGAGAFPQAQVFPAGGAAQGVVAADVNGDDLPDLVTANYYGPSNVSVLLNDPVCVFRSFAAGGSPLQVVARDFDSDHDLDLAVVNENGKFAVLANPGDGRFEAPATLDVGPEAQSVAAADFDGDGSVDLAVANFAEGGVSLLLNQGGGEFADRVRFDTGALPRFVTAADLDRDGRPDLVTANAAGSFTVLANRGKGNFERVADVSTGFSAGACMVTTADLDSDGDPDVVVDNFDARTLTVHRNDGSFRFAPRTTYSIGGVVWTAIGDFDGDQRPDLAVANFLRSRILILKNLGGTTFGAPVEVATAAGAHAVAVLDADGDGVLDLAVTGNYQLRIHRGRGDGTFTPLRTCPTRMETTGTLAVASVDEHAGTEILVCDRSAGSISVFPGGVDITEEDVLVPVAVHRAGASVVPGVLEWSTARPNPVVGAGVSFVARLPEAAPVDVRIYDAVGRLVHSAVFGTLPAGEHVIAWDGVPSTGTRPRAGVYFARLRAGVAEVRRKFVVLGRR